LNDNTKTTTDANEILDDALSSISLIYSGGDSNCIVLESDGYGEFPNSYNLTRYGLERILKAVIEANDSAGADLSETILSIAHGDAKN
jgi:hypothetical protein